MPGDINGFDPFPGPNRYPFADFWPGPASAIATPDYKNSEGFTSYVSTSGPKPGSSFSTRQESMEIDASTTGAEAASAIISNLGQAGAPATPSTLTPDQQTAVETAVSVLLAQAGIVGTDPVQVHFASNPDGKWAVLRVAVVKEV